MFSAIHSFIKEHQSLGYGDKKLSLRHISLCNNDQPTTEFMQVEFDFICRTSIPSIEYDDKISEIDAFKK
jgi:hypothetical protein